MNQTLAFLGAGHMAEALIRGLLAKQVLPATNIIAHDIRPDRLEELRKKYGIRTGPPDAAIIVLAVKPQQMRAALATLNPRPATLFLSIAAGITTGRIETALGGQPRVVRAMPNTPALVGAGAAAVCGGRWATAADVAVAEQILGAVGIVVRVEESLMDAVTALSGSGPAYVFFVTEAMIAAGISAGLPVDVANRLAVQTVLGAGKLLVETGEAPAELRRKVTSPGGTTEAALKVMTDRQLGNLFVEAIRAAAQRSRELAAG
jgi:pyrroline-5-carboxylate reductase